MGTRNRVSKWVFIFVVIMVLMWCSSSQSSEHPPAEVGRDYYINMLSLPNITLFGQPIPSNSLTRDRFAYVMAFHIDHLAKDIVVLERLSELDEYLTKLLEKNGLHSDFKYLFAWESGLDARANSGRAVGFAQFTRSTARRYGLVVTSWGDSNGIWDIDERMCPKAFEAGVEYLSDLKEKLSDPLLVAAAYNTGSSRVVRKMSEQKSDNFWDLWMFRETEDFIFHVLAVKILYESDIMHFKKRQPITFKTRIVRLKRDMTLKEYCAKNNLDFAELSRWNRHLREGVVPKRRRITIYIPMPYAGSS